MPRPEKEDPMPAVKAKPGSVLSRIKPVEFADAGLKCLLYGSSGTGKTHLWATFPGPILAIVCSGGVNSGELRTLTAEQRKKTREVSLRSSAELTEIVDHVKETGSYKTVVLDHASGLSDLIFKEILGLEKLPAQLSWGLATQQQYGQLALQCKERFRELLNLPGHVVIIAQERTFGGGDDAVTSEVIRPTVGAALTPSVTGWLNPACDYVMQTYKRPRMEKVDSKVGKEVVTTYRRGSGVEYCLRVEPHDVYMTKFRVPGGVKVDAVVDPTYDKLVKLING